MKKIKNVYIMKSWSLKTIKGLFLVGLILFLGACAGGGDASSPPPQIIDISKTPKTRATISWTAPIDGGAGASYDVRISENPIDETNFESAIAIQNVPVPGPANMMEQLTIPGLDIDKTYHVAIKTTDTAGNQSAISNVISFPSSQESLKINGENNGDLFGQSVSKAGDINGDGIPDFVIGGPLTELSGKGSIQIFFGGPTINSVPDIILEGNQTGDQFGFFVAGVGDVNGDGCSDIAVGAYKYDSPMLTDNGAVFIYFGAGGSQCPGGIDKDSLPNVIPDVIIEGLSDGGGFGYVVVVVGDINNQDGFSDFMVGAPFTDSNRGNVFLFYGGDSMPFKLDSSNADIKLIGESTGDRFGLSVNGGGDIDGDQVPDIVIGADKQTSTTNGGSAYVFFGTNLPALLGVGSALDADVEFSGILATDQLGWSVAITGDLNGDSKSDLVIGTPFPGGDQGRVFILYSDSPSGFISKNVIDADAILNGESSNDKFGWVVADAGDLNLDGLSDLIIGSPRSSSQKGSVYMFYGSSTLIGNNINARDADLFLVGEDTFSDFGVSVAGIGDTNGDGYDEFVVGAPRSDGQTLKGAVFINR